MAPTLCIKIFASAIRVLFENIFRLSIISYIPILRNSNHNKLVANNYSSVVNSFLISKILTGKINTETFAFSPNDLLL